jgi:type VI secretion system protein ImpJ
MNGSVVWREGLFIRPQHFQQSDRHFHDELMTRTIESGPNRWGLFALEIDRQLLNSGKFVINKAAGIMPDGTLFDVTTQIYAMMTEIDAADAGKTLYLALPLSIQHGDDLTFEEEEDQNARRIARREREVPNTNVGESSLTELLVAHPNFRIFRKEELNEGYEAIAVARIGSVSANGAAVLDMTFEPTYLHLNRSAYLSAQNEEMIKLLEFRMEKLSEKLSDASIQAAELGDYLLLQLINRFHSRLYFYNSQERVHPQELFLELHSLASELAVFMKKEKRLADEYLYDHQKQRESFDALLHDLKKMLSMVLEQNSVKLPLEERKYGIHVARIDDKSLMDTGLFVLAVTADIPTETLKKSLLANLKIGSVETIRDLVNFHLAGFKLKPLAAAPRQIPYRMNYIYFGIELTPEDRKKLKSSGGMALHLTGEVEGIVYNLWAIRSKKE